MSNDKDFRLDEAVANYYAKQQGMPLRPAEDRGHSMRLFVAHRHWRLEREPGYMQHALTRPRTNVSLAAEYDAYLEEREAARPLAPPEGQLGLPLGD